MATAALLAKKGLEVKVITRSGKMQRVDGVQPVAADANNTDRMVEIVDGAEALYNCANPSYNRWVTDWPPLSASMLETAERTGSVFVAISNLYGYGEVNHSMTERDPLKATGTKGRIRAQMWEQMLAAHEAGRANVVEARASDYFGPGVGRQSQLGGEVVASVLKGKTVSVFGNPDVPHSWTYVPDIAAALVKLGRESRAWGRPWHVPTNPPMTWREMITAIARTAGVKAPRVRSYYQLELRLAGVLMPIVRELDEVGYQFEQPFILDSSDFQDTFGASPTPMDEALRALVSWRISQPDGMGVGG
jgi:nucleoside-diphosphate-sugar epimerase